VAVRSRPDQSRTRFEPDPDEIKGYTTRGRGWEARQSWFLVFFLFFFTYWVPLVYMGLRVLQFRWVIYGFIYAGPAAILGIMLGTSDMARAAAESAPQQAADMAVAAHVGALRYAWYSAAAFWVFALIHTWMAREEFLMRLAEAHDERDDMRARVRQKLEETLEGDPEATAAPARRLLHWNTATETELAMLPGLGPQRAKEALELRSQVGGFGSFHQFAERLQLSEQTQTRLRPLFAEDEFGKTAEIAPSDPAYRVLPDGRRVLELNWASAETLAALPGLGPEVGRRAVALRDGDGPFKSLEDFRFRLNLTMDAIIKITPYVSVISMSTKAAGGSGTKTGGRIVDA
jgi:DNA uptake protein ComE-like DNA-binding protein